MELTLSEFVVAVLLVVMGMVLLFAFISRSYRLRVRARNTSRVVVCRLCLHAFQTEDGGTVVECPKCGAANEKGRSRRLG